MLKATATIREETDGFRVDVTWTGADLDRPCTGGWALGKGHRKLAERLKRAVDAQAVHENAKVVKDMFDQTYVQATCKVLGRHMNADLRRLGY